MKKTIITWGILALIALIISLCSHLKAQNTGIQLLKKNEVYLAKSDKEFVLDKYTFGKYHYIAQKYDSLKSSYTSLDSLYRQKDETIDYLQAEFNELWLQNEAKIKNMETSYQLLQEQTQQSLKQNSQLQLRYDQLQYKQQRTARWRNIFMGTTLVVGTVLVLVFTH